MYEGFEAESVYSGINKIVDSSDIIAEGTVNIANNDSEALEKLFDEIEMAGVSCAGYIYIENTNIQYPIAHGEDNTFYLTNDIRGQKNSRGSIFMDYRNNSDFSDANTILYGHNMRDKSMFHQLLMYGSAQFAQEAETILILRETEVLEYAVFAAYKIDQNADYLKINFENEREFKLYIDGIEERSDIESAYDIKIEDRLLTLSTCDNAGGDARYVVHAVLRGLHN